MTHKEIKLVVKTVFLTLFFIWLGWCLWSWYDLVSHQLSGGTQNPLNLYNIIRGLA